MARTIGVLQEDNLVRFLNAVESTGDILGVLDLEEQESLELKAEAGKILGVRGELGAFFNVFDVETALNFEGPLGRALTNAARRPLLMGPAVARFGGEHAASHLSLRFLGRLLFDIEWVRDPAEWVRPLMRLLIATSSKRLTIGQDLARAENMVASVKKRLKMVADAGEDTTALEAELERANGRVKELEREAEALNKAIRDRDHRAVWAIVRRNLLAEKAALVAQANAIKPTTPGQAREKNRLEDEAAELQREIDAIEREVRDYKPD